VVLYDEPNFKYKMVYRKRTGPWTIPKIINYAVKETKSLYLMILGVDHIISPEWIKFAMKSNVGYGVFTRKYAVILEDGTLLKIRYKDIDCTVDYSSLGWIRRNHFIKLNGLEESLSGPTKGSADVNLFRKWCNLRGSNRSTMIAEGRSKNPFCYMLPEKKSIKLNKGRKGGHWRLLSHLRPVHFLHKLPDRDRNFKKASEVTLMDNQIDKMNKFVSFVDLDNKVRDEYKFSDLIFWRHAAEIRWMLGEFKE
jgi:hypothetical protein